MSESDLKVMEVARYCKCSRNTVINYTNKGIISPVRDLYGRRRYSQADADRLRQILSARWPDSRPNQKPPDSGVLAAFTGVEKPTSVKASKHIFEN